MCKLLSGLALVLWLFGCTSTQAPPSPDPAPSPPPAVQIPSPDPVEISPVLETRSLSELQRAACRGAGGEWRCQNVAPPKTFAAPTSPVLPTSWTVPAWFIDFANVSGTASDTNDCVTSATACRTYGEIAAHRWGTYEPQLQQQTIITTLSGWPSTSLFADQFIYRGTYAGNLFVIGTLGTNETIVSGTLAGVVAKAKPNTLLQATLSAPTAVGQLIHNTTHDSYAWVLTSLGGGNFEITQPMTQPGPTFLVGSEVNTWANGDAYTVFAPERLNLGDVTTHSAQVPVFAFYNIVGNVRGPVQGLFEGCGVGIGGLASFRSVGSFGSVQTQLDNVYNANSILLTAYATNGLLAGVLNAGAWVGGNNLQGSFNVANDFITTGLVTILQSSQSLASIWLRGSSFRVLGPVSIPANGYIAGNQTVDVQGSGRIQWPATQTATNTFLQTAATPFLINGVTTACSIVLATGVWTCNQTVNVANIDNAAVFAGNVIGPSGARITNAAN